jgi:hypothetical protein
MVVRLNKAVAESHAALLESHLMVLVLLLMVLTFCMATMSAESLLGSNGELMVPALQKPSVSDSYTR